MSLQLLIMGFLGLVAGRFVNIVIHRLPAMILWDGEDPPPATLRASQSRCMSCQSGLPWYHNAPLLCHLVRAAQCRFCKAPISVLSPILELAVCSVWLTAGLAFYQPVFVFDGVVWACFASAFIAMALIDWETALLPDVLTLGCVWAGLLASSAGITGISLEQSLYGAVAGYLSFKTLITIGDKFAGRQTMGLGDAKLMAAIGSILGLVAFPAVLLVASSTSIVGYYWLKSRSKLFDDRYAPFGPFLIAGAVTVFVFERIWPGLVVI